MILAQHITTTVIMQDSTLLNADNSVVTMLQNKERRELEFALHVSETANRQQVQDRLVALSIKNGTSLNPRRKKEHRVQPPVYSQTKEPKIKPPLAVIRKRMSLADAKHKNLFASQRFGSLGAPPASAGGDKKDETTASDTTAAAPESATPVKLSIEQQQDEDLKNLRAHIDLPHIKTLLPAYDGDMFGTSGNYWQGQLYMARMTPAQEHVKTNRFNFHQETPRYVAKNMEKVDITSKQNACRSVCNLTWHSSNALAVISEGGLAALQNMVETEADNIIQTNSAIAFHNLARIPEMRQRMIEQGVVGTIAKAQIKAPNMEPAVVLHMLGTLASLSCAKYEKGVEAKLLQQRALDILAFSTKSLHKINGGPGRPMILAHTLGARVLLNLTTCFDERTTYDQAIDVIAECLSRLTHFLMKPTTGNVFNVQKLLVQALCNVAAYENNRARMVSQGVVGVMFKSWDQMKNSADARKYPKEMNHFRHAAAALVLSLSNCKGELRVTMIRQKSVQLLDSISSPASTSGASASQSSEEDQETRQRCVQALGNLASGGHGDGRAATSVLPAILKLSKNNDPATRKRCAQALRDMSERPFSRKLILEKGASKVLSRMLDAEHVHDARPTKVKVDCLVALCNLLIYPNTQLPSVSGGTVDIMLTTFERGAGKAERLCCITIQRLLEVPKAREYVTNNRTLLMLMNLMISSNDMSVIEQVTSTIAGLVANEKTGKQILELEGLTVEPVLAFLQLVRDRSEQSIRCSALAALTFLSHVDGAVCHTIVSKGASIITDAVIGKHDDDSYVDPDIKLWCASLLCQLSSHAQLRRELIDHDCCAALSILAKTDSAVVQSCTSRTFCYFSDCTDSESTTSDIVSSGAVTSLIALSSAHDESTRSNCATALCNLAWGADLTAARTIVGAGVVNELMILALVRSDSATTKLTCLMALANLLDGGEILEKMVEQGLVWAMTMASSLDKLQDNETLAERGLSLVAAVYSDLVRTDMGCQRLISEHGGIKAVARLIGSRVALTSCRGWDVLRNMCRRDCQQRLIDEGCLEVLANMKDNETSGSSSQGDSAVVHNLSALVAFLLRSEDGRVKLVSESVGLLSRMCRVYGGEAEIETRRYASEVACRLASDDRTSRIFVVRGGLDMLNDMCQGHFKRSKKTSEGYVYDSYTRSMLTTALLHLSMHGENVDDLGDSLCLTMLRGLAETDDVGILEKVVATVRSLAWGEKNHESLVHEHHAVRLLCEIAKKAPCTRAMQLDFADALCNLSYHLTSQSYRDIVDDGAIVLLVSLANSLLDDQDDVHADTNGNSDERSLSDMSKLRITISLCHLATEGGAFAEQLIDQNVLSILIRMIKTRGCPLDIRRDCLSTLCSLSFSADSRGDEMIDAGVYEVVTQLSRSSDAFVRKCCGTVLSNLSPFAKDAVEGSVAALLDLCMPTDGGDEKSSNSSLQRKTSGSLLTADGLEASSAPPADWPAAWVHWNSLCKHGSAMLEGVEIIFLQPSTSPEDKNENKSNDSEEVFWQKVAAGSPVSHAPEIPPPPPSASLDEIADLGNPSVITNFSSILQEDDDDVESIRSTAAKSSSLNFPVGEYVFKDAKSGEAHWLNPRTASSWPVGPPGCTPIKSPKPYASLEAQMLKVRTSFFFLPPIETQV